MQDEMPPSVIPARMSKQHNPLPRDKAGSAAAIRKTTHRRRLPSRERNRRGRLWLLLVFCVLRVSDALTYFGSPAGDRHRLLAAIIVGAAWTTVAMVGLWFRKGWCRYALSVLVLASTIASTFLMPGVFQLPANYRVLGFLFAGASVNAAVIWALISLHDIRRFTSRAYL